MPVREAVIVVWGTPAGCPPQPNMHGATMRRVRQDRGRIAARYALPDLHPVLRLPCTFLSPALRVAASGLQRESA
jgi:hypothetical protein